MLFVFDRLRQLVEQKGSFYTDIPEKMIEKMRVVAGGRRVQLGQFVIYWVHLSNKIINLFMQEQDKSKYPPLASSVSHSTEKRRDKYEAQQSYNVHFLDHAIIFRTLRLLERELKQPDEICQLQKRGSNALTKIRQPIQQIGVCQIEWQKDMKNAENLVNKRPPSELNKRITFDTLLFIKEMQKKQNEQLTAFLSKYKSSLSKEVCSAGEGQIKASIAHVEDVEEAALRIQNGELVAFPTETVYGLGANALNPEALKRIYATKRRPLTDPIIVHVLDSTEAKKLVEMDTKQAVLFELLTKRYWPGPLTIILKANLDILPAIVTAQTGYVGIRAPKHPYARRLIQVSKLPIGAPSANLFSHVSPTEPVHVFNDFFNCPISIVDGQRCEYGVESTVIKLVQNQINVLREGSLSISRLQSFLKEMIPEQQLPAVIIHRKVIGKNINMEAPGQLLKHYAPYLPCYFFCEEQAQPGVEFQNKTNEHRFKLSETAFISFSQKHYSTFAEKCKFYFQVEKTGEQEEQGPSEEEDLFCSKEDKVKMREIYSLLRQCQNLQVSGIVIGWGSAREGTLWDKIFRSTQGEHVVTIF